jgi:hypothetical protein|nr:MAG TPA: hypothetical protein [Caudoviricetes sp.]
MAEFLTMQEAEDKFGKKGKTNAALTLGIIGTALGAFTGNNGCGCGGNNGILGGLFGGNNNCCAMQQAQQAQQKTQPILDEINREVGSLSVDEQNVLAKTQEYQMAKQTYEAGFMAFLGTKFSAEYVNSPDGKVAAENLLATIRKSKEFIQSQIKAKEEKVNTLLELMESDPEMKKRFDELMMNKTAK